MTLRQMHAWNCYKQILSTTINLFNSPASRQRNFENNVLKFDFVFSFAHLFKNEKQY